MQTKLGAKKAAQTRAKNRKLKKLAEKQKYDQDRLEILGDGLKTTSAESYKPREVPPEPASVEHIPARGMGSAKQHTASQLLVWAVLQMCKGAIPSASCGPLMMVVPFRDLDSVRILAEAVEAAS